MINSMDLVDVWRDKNYGVRRYTWRGPNKKQRSDHSPVSIVLKFLNQTRGRGDMEIQ